MNCEDVQKQLSDLPDKSRDIERAREIQDHLAACSVCSAEMTSLAEYQQLMSNLPIVEPPVGFTARVMAEVRETAHPPTVWERLFLPLQIEIPLQATAVIVIAVLAAYIYQKEPLQRESVVSVQPKSSFRTQEQADKLTPSTAQAPSADSKTTEGAKQGNLPVQQFKDSAQLKKSQSPLKPEEENKGMAGNQFAAPDAARSQDQIRSPATLSPTPLQEKSSGANEAAAPSREQSSPPLEVRAKGALAPVPQPEKENASKDAAAAGKPLLPSEARGRSATSFLSGLRSGTVVGVALPADHELAIRLKEPGRDEKAAGDRLTGSTETERRPLILQEEAKNLDQARQQAIQTAQSQTVWVTIARNQYELFKKDLADLGNIEADSSTPDRKNDTGSRASDRLRIKVTILPPLSSGNPVSSQPSGR